MCGAGKIGKVHIANLRTLRGCELSGVYDVNSTAVEQVCREYDVRVYASGDEMLADARVDAVVIATPSSSHRDWCERSLAAGKHVFVEKPLAGTLDDAAAITSAARSSGRVVQVGFCERFNAQHLEAKRAVQAGAVGRVRAIHSSRVAPYSMSDPSWDLGVLDTAVHNIDLILWIMGRSPATVLARGTRVYADSAIPHTATILLQFDDGSMAVDHIAWLKDDAHPLHHCPFADADPWRCGGIHNRFDGTSLESSV
jgi:predicted dehydrogenase